MRPDVTSHRPVFVDDPSQLDAIVVDELDAQLAQLARCRSPRAESPPPVVLGEPAPWVFYPWRRTVVRVLPKQLHRELRLDRNRYAITDDEQERLTNLTIAVAGLSVGRAVVTTLVHEGIGGELRLADFDVLDLSNLNRITGGLADVGVSKVVLAAREVAELDPYIKVVVFPEGVDATTIGAFTAGADVIVDECDDLETKVRLREHARVPVVMATSHRGMLDVERFDREPGRPPFHGLLGDVSADELGGLTTKQKVPYVIRILDPSSLTDRAAASMVEVKESVSTWPQLASEVALGGAMVTNAIRRIALGTHTTSGRFYCDLDALAPVPVELPAAPAARPRPQRPERGDDLRFIVACASSAPSGGNMQPWRFQARDGAVRAWLDRGRMTSLLDFRDRGGLLALGAALEAATVGAHALGYATTVDLDGDPVWELRLTPGGDPDPGAADILWERCSNRHSGDADAVPELAELAAAARPLSAHVLEGDALHEVGRALGGLDRVRFLSDRYRADMLGELRFSAAEAARTRDGIDVAALELDPADRAAMDVLKTGAGMGFLAAHDRGWSLANLARDAFRGSGGAIVLRAEATGRAALVEAGRGLMRLWLEATRRGIAVHPWGSPFLFQRLLEDGDWLDDWEHRSLAQATLAFDRVVGIERERPVLLILRISRATAAPSVRSLRRELDEVLA